MISSWRRLAVFVVGALLLVVSLPVIADLSLSPSPALAAEGSFEVLIDDDDDSHAPRVREFAGATRYETSLAAAKRFIDTAHALGTPVSTAVVASGESLIDAAASAGLARAVNGPVLLTQPGEIFIPAAHLIEAAGITRVIIVGGEAAVSAQVFAALRAVPGVQSVERIGGRNRFDTAALIAKEANSQENYCNSGQRAAVLVAGDSSSFADVTVAGPMSYAMGIPVLLVKTNGEVPTETGTALSDLGIEHAVVVGGSYSIANLDSLTDGLNAFGAVTVTRLEGANQFATSVRVLEALKECLGSAFSDESVALISDTALPDGVSAAPMLGQGLNGDSKVTPILLVGSTNFPVEVKDYLSSTSSAISLTTIGGENAVSNDVARAAVAAANGENFVIPGLLDTFTSGDPNVCRLVGFNAPGHGYLGDITHGFDQHVHDVVSVGFPLPTFAAPIIGALRIAVLFVDFPNAPANHSTNIEGSVQLAEAERYLESTSYGQLDVQFETLNRWLRAPNRWQNYAVQSAAGSQTLDTSLLSREAITLADPVFDFSDDFDAVMTVAPSSYFGGGVASPRLNLVPEDPNLSLFTIVNSQPHSQSLNSPQVWWYVAVHELMHNLGLTDLYSYDSNEFKTPTRRAPSGQAWTTIETGLMGLRGHLLVDIDDTRFYPDISLPSGWTLTEGISTHSYFRPIEMLAWSRWQVDWLREDQVACLTETAFDETLTLSPIAAPVATAMVVIPINKTSAIVIESRRSIGYDNKTVIRTPCCQGAGDQVVRVDNLAQEGILIYEVDTSRGNGELPLTFWFADSSNALRLSRYPILKTGSTTLDTLSDGSRLRISVESDDGDAHLVRVIRS